MPHAYSRARRVAEQIHRETARILETKATDPRFQNLTITGVDVSPDLTNALIFITLHDEQQRVVTLAALNKAAGFFRHELANILDMRITPKIKFLYDESISTGSKIANLLNKIDKKNEE